MLGAMTGGAMRSAIVCLAVFVSSAVAQPAFDWITVGNPGNSPAPLGDPILDPATGSVGYGYRITRSPVTADRWLEFVRAYQPYYTGDPYSWTFLGRMVTVDGDVPKGPNGEVTYTLSQSRVNHPTTAGLEFVARYCNWLHNGMAAEQWAFESGVYDTSTFFTDDQGVEHHDFNPAEGARYRIPTLSELLKAAFYDPEANGGHGHWWQYSNRSDDPLVIGRPEDGGETIGDLVIHGDWPVGQYPDTTSAYGMLDYTGSVYQWTSTGEGDHRYAAGSFSGSDAFWVNYDGSLLFGPHRAPVVLGHFYGFRLVSPPCPADLAPPTGTLNAADLIAYLDLYHASDPAADLADPLGTLNFFDLAAYLQAFSAGCP
jgi:formylglycine-generating enzyme required for sulfatase activity